MRFTTWKRAAAGFAAVAITGGLALTAGGAADAASPSCGWTCIEVFNHNFGTHAHPNFILDTQQQAGKTGQPQILFRVSNSDPGEDYTVSFQGLVSDFFAAGLVSSAVNLHYGGGAFGFPDDYAYEVQYAPFGVDSGLCAGLASVAVAGEKVTLQPCGITAETVWIVDSQDSTFTGYVPLINGSDTNFSRPYVLTYPGSGYPTDIPRPQLFVTNLTGFSNGTTNNPSGVNDNQLWGFDQGVLP